ncbi:adenylosuccinate synthase [Spiroplasma culicicola]|uniref:Adenylosuccinate synthetase n=1 Tax=Spiroplasma culicicola AES-1 TaxID=1276246 RepID=W6A8P6_9MOLU|nr:adenylosuccinate synthase [Spiroplasma culicicola]AHI53392.1 adenylosuccinate synthetase [Spiroplasma culicicola AES-1]
MKKYNTLVVVGSQWGDEGKGKVTDYFAQKTNIVVRFSGGDNAGHVINFNGQKHKVTIIPSGIFNKKVINVIGNGCVLNLRQLVSEFEIIKNSGVEYGTLLISNRTQLVLPYHILIDGAQEDSKGENKIGTTKRGIGPAYQDKVSRIGVRLGDLANPNFKQRFEQIYLYQQKFLKNMYNIELNDFENTYNQLIEDYNTIKNNIIDSGEYVEAAIKEGKKVLFEGAQGAMLDIDHGTYPYVTSSNCSASNVALGTGLGFKYVDSILGVVKAYSTRVGAGGFPTELNDAIGDGIRERGNEYGSNTKRPRRIGWLDAVALKYSIRTSGLDKLFITLLDVLSGMDEIKICNKYLLDGREITNVPATSEEFEKCEPVYISTPGWSEDITKVTSFTELPDAAKNYLKLIEKICETDIVGFSVGPDRTQTVLLEEVF